MTRISHRPAWRIFMAAASCVFLVSVSVERIDRPVATWVDRHLGLSRFVWLATPYGDHPLAINPFNLMIGPVEAIRPLALAVLAMIVLAAASGWRPRMQGRIALALSVSVLVAMDINGKLQLAFGRTWPESWMGNNPSWTGDGAFGFFPFHGGLGWGSFPSGHTSAATALATVLWIVWPKSRLLWVSIVVMDAGGLIGGNYHFLSDIIGGVYLGVAAGLGTAALMLSPNDRLGRVWPPAAEPALAADDPGAESGRQ